MSLRRALLAALSLAALVLAAGCTPETPPTTQVATPAVTQVAAVTAHAGAVPARQWRAVLVAGDNSIPAFDNGVETLRDRLAAQGVRDISVLSADPAVAGARLASAANLRRALQARGGEACLAFLTSHGDERGFLLSVERGLLRPASLEQALDAGCGSAPTVLIVSACHSGGFINDRSRKPNRVILTAAATDRASFGCGADQEYTYYDRCLLRQFDEAKTWRELALATRSCVESQERRLGIRQASRPQIFVGTEVADLRIPGR